MAIPPWLIKAGISAAAGKASGDEEGGSAVKAAVSVAAGTAAFLIVLSGLLVSLVSDFVGYTSSVDDEYDITQTELFTSVADIHTDYYKELRDDMKKREEELIEENTYYVDVTEAYTDENGEIKYKTTQEKRCDVRIHKSLYPIDYAYTYAYINHISDVKRGKQYKVTFLEKIRLEKFLRHISMPQEDRKGDDIYLYNDILTPEDVAEAFFLDAEETSLQEQYVLSYNLYAEMFFLKNITQGLLEDVELPEDIFLPEMTDSGIALPHYFQNGGQPWSNMKYGGGTIASSGCGPTCIAMVMSGLKGRDITPADVVNWAGRKYYVPGAGSSWGIYPAAASKWGVPCKNLGKNTSAVIKAIEDGKPVIASMGPGTFTSAGHFIVLRGVTADGCFIVNDPNIKNYKNKGDTFKCATVFREAKNYWSFG